MFINVSLKCENESDGVSTLAKLDGCTCKSNALYVQRYCEGVIVVYR